jgi:hypothetical protein
MRDRATKHKGLTGSGHETNNWHAMPSPGQFRFSFHTWGACAAHRLVQQLTAQAALPVFQPVSCCRRACHLSRRSIRRGGAVAWPAGRPLAACGCGAPAAPGQGGGRGGGQVPCRQDAGDACVQPLVQRTAGARGRLPAAACPAGTATAAVGECSSWHSLTLFTLLIQAGEAAPTCRDKRRQKTRHDAGQDRHGSRAGREREGPTEQRWLPCPPLRWTSQHN